MTEKHEWPKRFFSAMDSIYIPCNHCKHRNGNTVTCKAYPQGIPKKLMLRGEHDTPFPGDNGIRFEPKS